MLKRGVNMDSAMAFWTGKKLSKFEIADAVVLAWKFNRVKAKKHGHNQKNKKA